jgi:hypothetical protein
VEHAGGDLRLHEGAADHLQAANAVSEVEVEEARLAGEEAADVAPTACWNCPSPSIAATT